MNKLGEYIVFKRFLAPYLLQFLFWAGIAGTLFGAGWLFVRGNWAWVTALVFGILATRLIFEFLFALFRIPQLLLEIRDRLSKQNGNETG